MNDTDLMNIRRAAYEAACLAENAWEDELIRTYGAAVAVSARYDSKRNAATPTLKALYDVRHYTTEAWAMLGKLARNEIAA